MDQLYIKQIILGGGCFWKIQLHFQRLEGVINTFVGYCGGNIQYPSYKLICTGATGHAEVVLIQYDSSIITLHQILGEFFQIHDPTQKDRQGLDIGTQYRSCIFYEDDLEEIENYINILQSEYDQIIQTQVDVASKFWMAEELHQRYLEKAGQSAEKGCDEIIQCYN